MRCPNCGHDNPDDDSYCGACGSSLSSEDASLLDDHREPDDDYYTYEWFGIRYTFAKWRWQLSLVVLGGMLLVYAAIFASFGWFVNAIMLVSVAILGVYLYRRIGEKKSGVGALFLAGLVIAAGLLAGFMPWQMWAEEDHQRAIAPRLTADLTYTVDNGAHIVVSGTVTNTGRTGCTAVVHIKAYGGWTNDTSIMFGGFSEGTVTTNWLAPGGGSDSVHWECTLSYFNEMGQVTWTVEPGGT